MQFSKLQTWTALRVSVSPPSPAPGAEDGLDGADGLPRLADEEGDVAQLGHGRQEAHVVGEPGLVLEDRRVGVLVVGVEHSLRRHLACLDHYQLPYGTIRHHQEDFLTFVNLSLPLVECYTYDIRELVSVSPKVQLPLTLFG